MATDRVTPSCAPDLPHALVERVTMLSVARESDRHCKLLAERAPGLLKTLREHDPGFVLLDGTLVATLKKLNGGM